MKFRELIHLGVASLVTVFIAAPTQAASIVTIEKKDQGAYDVKFAGRLFTTLHTQGFPKPILYPIIGPYGVRMTRDWPMKDGTPNERRDHPHHQSLWFTHGDVNGISFWSVGGNSGKIVTTKVTDVVEHGADGWIGFEDKWVDVKGKVICTDQQKITFHKYRVRGAVAYAAIDYEVTIHASEGDVVFGDTKEGTMGLRSHPDLRINRGATAVNSEGVTGKAVWGKRAKWVDYSAEVEGHKVGFAIMDHPSNLRHPTWWHARDYGLVAANPFGIHYFENKPKGTGNYKLPKGQSLTFRYRFIFHSGDAKQAGIAEQFDRYAAGE